MFAECTEVDARPRSLPVHTGQGLSRTVARVSGWLRSPPATRSADVASDAVASDAPPPAAAAPPDASAALAAPAAAPAPPIDSPSSARPDPTASDGGLLSLPPVRALWTALSLSTLGDWLGLLAATSLAVALASSSYVAAGTAIAAVFALRLIPPLLLDPVAHVVTDRFGRRWTMVGGDAIRAALCPLDPTRRPVVVAVRRHFLGRHRGHPRDGRHGARRCPDLSRPSGSTTPTDSAG